MTKIIYAVGIHSDGGLNILEKFLNSCDNDVIFYLDNRIKIKKKENYIFVNGSSFNRLIHLFKLKSRTSINDHIFFLNGLPPVLKFNSEISVAFQNANIFRSFYRIGFLNWIFSRDILRNFIFSFGKKNVDNWFVFSPISQRILNKELNKYSNIKIINVLSEFNNKVEISSVNYKYDFIYPASGLKHKNHNLLFETLIQLSKENIYPKVLITLEQEYLNKINFHKYKKKYNLKIENYFEKNQKIFRDIYKQCRCLLYLSKNETIGLPILEANKYGLFTIAPDLDYSSQFLEPDFKFDINSKNELKNIIKNFLLKPPEKKNIKDDKIKIENSLDFENFLNYIL
tara:strand:+ start:1091 stop:2116 length:1026 start_codon:yes stop_codon:yes gene_type:complete